MQVFFDKVVDSTVGKDEKVFEMAPPSIYVKFVTGCIVFLFLGVLGGTILFLFGLEQYTIVGGFFETGIVGGCFCSAMLLLRSDILPAQERRNLRPVGGQESWPASLTFWRC
jgi:hypothetical protein